MAMRGWGGEGGCSERRERRAFRSLLAVCSGREDSLAQDAVGTFHLVLTLGDSCVVQLLAHYELLRAGGLPQGAILAVQAQTCARIFAAAQLLSERMGVQGEDVDLRAY